MVDGLVDWLLVGLGVVGDGGGGFVGSTLLTRFVKRSGYMGEHRMKANYLI